MNKKLIGGSAAGLLLATAIIGRWEGKRNDPYLDIVGVPTVCYGETRVEMKTYTDAECKQMLQEAVKDYQQGVIACVPSLVDRPYQLAASTSLAYNIGVKPSAARLSPRSLMRVNTRQAVSASRLGNMQAVKSLKALSTDVRMKPNYA